MSKDDRIAILLKDAATDLTVPIAEPSADDWERIRAVNLRGPSIPSTSPSRATGG
jgi:hypothetical protein